jgi:outer membrane protein assembly factor BamE (lipoprotein component of BamABCDE complex)
MQLARERATYSQKSQQLESAYQKINLGMTKEQVKTIAGEPHSSWKNELGEVWYWSARNYQSSLWDRVGLATTKGHFDTSIIFDESGKVSKKYGGIN